MIEVASLNGSEAFLAIRHATPLQDIEPLSLVRVAGGVRASKTLAQVQPYLAVALEVEPNRVVAMTLTGKKFAVQPDFVEPASAVWCIVDGGQVIASAPILSELVDAANDAGGVGTGRLLDAIDNSLDRIALSQGDYGEWGPGDEVQIALEHTGGEVTARVVGSVYERDLSKWYRVAVGSDEYLVSANDLAAFNTDRLMWSNPTLAELDEEERESTRFSCYHKGAGPHECRDCWEHDVEIQQRWRTRANCAKEGRRFRD